MKQFVLKLNDKWAKHTHAFVTLTNKDVSAIKKYVGVLRRAQGYEITVAGEGTIQALWSPPFEEGNLLPTDEISPRGIAEIVQRKHSGTYPLACRVQRRDISFLFFDNDESVETEGINVELLIN